MPDFRVVVYLSSKRGDETPETQLEINADEPRRIESAVASADVIFRVKGYNDDDDDDDDNNRDDLVVSDTPDAGAAKEAEKDGEGGDEREGGRASSDPLEKPVLDFGAKSPKGQTYFIQPARRSELYSLQFSLRFKRALAGDDLVLSNEVDQKIALPWGTSAALKIAQWIDPGLEHNIYDESTPWLHGAVLSSINDMAVQRAETAEDSSTSLTIRWPTTMPLEEDLSILSADLPASACSSASKRKRHFLGTEAKQSFTFERDLQYDFDFHNGFVDFHRMKLCLPGMKINVLPYWNGQSCFRYALFKLSF